MLVTVDSRNPTEARVDLLALPLVQIDPKQWRLPARLEPLDRAIGGGISAVLRSGDFQGKTGQTCAIYPDSWAERAIAEDAADGSIQSLLDDLLHRPIEESEWRAWGEDGRSWFSVDTEEALQEGIERFGPPPG